MAKRLNTLEELAKIITEEQAHLSAIAILVSRARQQRERFFNQGQTPTEIKAQMDLLYGDMEQISNQVEAELGGVHWKAPAEVRIGTTGTVASPGAAVAELHHFSMTISAATIIAEDLGTNDLTAFGTLFAVDDIIELTGAEDKENSQTVEVLSSTTTAITLRNVIPGGVDNVTDETMKIIMKVDNSESS